MKALNSRVTLVQWIDVILKLLKSVFIYRAKNFSYGRCRSTQNILTLIRIRSKTEYLNKKNVSTSSHKKGKKQEKC